MGYIKNWDKSIVFWDADRVITEVGSNFPKEFAESLENTFIELKTIQKEYDKYKHAGIEVLVEAPLTGTPEERDKKWNARINYINALEPVVIAVKAYVDDEIEKNRTDGTLNRKLLSKIYDKYVPYYVYSPHNIPLDERENYETKKGDFIKQHLTPEKRRHR